MATTTKTFLDYNGLEKLWTKISNGFSPRWLAYRPSDSAAVGTNTTEVILRYQSAGTANDGALGGEKIVKIPAATTSSAGVMSADDKKALDSIGTDINNAINLQNVAIEGNILKTATISTKEKAVNIGLDYSTQKIRLLDRNDNNKVVASVDLTNIIKDRFLTAAEVVNTKDGDTAPTGLYLKLTFIVKDLANNVDVTESIYIDVDDLIDIYNAGEGIEINQGAENTADGAKRSSTINLKAAATGELGGICVGKVSEKIPVTATTITNRYFGVELGKDNKAIVNVPIGSLTAGNNVISGTAILNPATGSTVNVITGVNSISNNNDKTGNIITLGGTTISLAKETSATTPATTANTAVTLKFGETFTPLMSISGDSTETHPNGHCINSTKTTFTLPTPSIEFTAISYTSPTTPNEITATNDGSCIIVNQIDGFTGGVSNTGKITITPTYSSKKYWVDVESIADTVIDGLQYPAK